MRISLYLRRFTHNPFLLPCQFCCQLKTFLSGLRARTIVTVQAVTYARYACKKLWICLQFGPGVIVYPVFCVGLYFIECVVVSCFILAYYFFYHLYFVWVCSVWYFVAALWRNK